jgi:hypothetical protein
MSRQGGGVPYINLSNFVIHSVELFSTPNFEKKKSITLNVPKQNEKSSVG